MSEREHDRTRPMLRLNEGLEALESKNKYLENHSRRDNIKIIGLEEKADEKTWDDTEQVVK